jgi:hypothetical protein
MSLPPGNEARRNLADAEREHGGDEDVADEVHRQHDETRRRPERLADEHIFPASHRPGGGELGIDVGCGDGDDRGDGEGKDGARAGGLEDARRDHEDG